MRMSGHKGKEKTVHQTSYAVNPPVKALVQRAGGDVDHIKQFHPAHYEVEFQEQLLVNELVELLVPKLVSDHAEIKRRFDEARTPVKRKQARLFTLKGSLGWQIHAIGKAILLLACPLVDPETCRLDPTNKQSLWAQCHNESLAALLNHQAFRSKQFRDLQAAVLTKMERAQNYLANTPAAVNPMEAMIDNRVVRPIHQISSFQHSLFHQCHSMMELLLNHQAQIANLETKVAAGGPVVGPVNSPASPASPATTTPAARRTHSVVTPDNSSTELPAQSVTIADGVTPRKRRAPIRRVDAISREWKRRELSGEEDLPQMELIHDRDCHSLRDYVTKWDSNWKPKELATGGGWRANVGGGRGNTAIWNRISPIFRLVDHYRDDLKLSTDEAIVKAEVVWSRIPAGKRTGGKPNKKAIGEAFKAELKALNLHSNGRPKGRKTAPAPTPPTPPTRNDGHHIGPQFDPTAFRNNLRRHPPPNQHYDPSAFGAAFPLPPAEEERLRAEVAQAEARRQQILRERRCRLGDHCNDDGTTIMIGQTDGNRVGYNIGDSSNVHRGVYAECVGQVLDQRN